ncbi:hypothetical protein [Streptomyces sp. NPDC054866]
MGHGVRWTVVVLSTLGAFAVPWTLLTLTDAGPEAALALASTTSAAVLSAGGWFAARDPAPVHRAAGTAPPPPADGPLLIGPLPHEPLAFQERAELFEAIETGMQRNGVTVVCALTGGRGVGKTQLAGAYARACVDAGWRVVVWIVAEVPGQVVAGLDELADAADVKGGIQDAQLSATARGPRRRPVASTTPWQWERAVAPCPPQRWEERGVGRGGRGTRGRGRLCSGMHTGFRTNDHREARCRRRPIASSSTSSHGAKSAPCCV